MGHFLLVGTGTEQRASVAALTPAGFKKVHGSRAVFTVIGANTSLALGFNAGVALVAVVLTGTFGGLIRDVLTGRVPLILRKEIYATAALAGAAVYWGWSLPTFSRHVKSRAG
jgi:uncharacterized membrane protein YeiH